MPNLEKDREEEHDVAVVAQTHKKLKKPSLYKVLLHNDNYTTMEFVVDILRTIFHKSNSEASSIMLAVHHQGVGTAGVYTHEIAETKVEKVTQLAREREFPLHCTVEEA